MHANAGRATRRTSLTPHTAVSAARASTLAHTGHGAHHATVSEAAQLFGGTASRAAEVAVILLDLQSQHPDLDTTTLEAASILLSMKSSSGGASASADRQPASLA